MPFSVCSPKDSLFIISLKLSNWNMMYKKFVNQISTVNSMKKVKMTFKVVSIAIYDAGELIVRCGAYLNEVSISSTKKKNISNLSCCIKL